MRESTIFYRSFYEAIKELPKEAQSEIYTAIFEYSLNFNEVELSGISKTVFTLIKPQLDANIQRYRNGNIPKDKQEESKQEANKKQNRSKTEANANVNDNHNENKNDNHNKLFERFWNLYNKKVDRKKCESKFSKLKQQDIDKIFETLPAYIARTPDIKFRKDPSTYLNNQCWNDEIGEQTQSANSVIPFGKVDKLDGYVSNGVWIEAVFYDKEGNRVDRHGNKVDNNGNRL